MADIKDKNELKRRIDLFLDKEIDYSINEEFCMETMRMMKEFIGHASHRIDCADSKAKSSQNKLKQYKELLPTPQMVKDLINMNRKHEKNALENAHIVDEYRSKQEQGLLLFNSEELKTAIIDRMQELRDEYKQYSESTIDHFGGKADSMEVAIRIVKGAFEEATARMKGE